jgi:hypothetical protein
MGKGQVTRPTIWDIMPSIEHEKVLAGAISALKEHGFRVIRLDKRVYPDAIASKGSTLIAVEAETGSVSGKGRPFTDFDATVIVQRKVAPKYHTMTEYRAALALRNQGLTYTQIVRELTTRFKRPFSRNIIFWWCKGKGRPPNGS